MTRRRLEAQESRTLILDAVERLMQREGYASVNTRTVANEAGVKPTLVHYHFETTENLLLEAYRRSALQTEARLLDVVASDDPLRAIWHFNADPSRTALANQFMALAGHRPALGEEIAANVEKFRMMQESALARVMDSARLANTGLSADAAVLLIAAIGRAIIMEQGIGIARGHDELRSVVERIIDHWDKSHSPPVLQAPQTP